MLYVAPTEIAESEGRKTIFIAGGITGCADWQTEIAALIDTDRYDVFNPRRPEGLEKTGEEATKQIAWERDALARSNFAVFWFPETSICPITLFEYGVMLERASRGEIGLLMGRHPDYERAFDLDVQTHLVAENCPAADDLAVAESFDELKAAVELWFGFDSWV